MKNYFVDKMEEHSSYYYEYDRNGKKDTEKGFVDTIEIENLSDTLDFGNKFNYDDVSFNINYDTLKFNESNVTIPELPETPNYKNGFWKYHEDVILKEIRDYLGGTYRSHYASPESKTQTLDLIESVGDAEPFCRSNALKYLSRFGKKDGKSKQDILKAIHYCILLYHFAGLCNENPHPYETF